MPCDSGDRPEDGPKRAPSKVLPTPKSISVRIQEGQSSGRKLGQRISPDIMSPEQPQFRTATKRPDVAPSKRPTGELRFDIAGWIEKHLVQPGFDAQMTSEVLGQVRMLLLQLG